MTKSELIERIVSRQPQLSSKDVELAVKTLLDHMSQTLSSGERIEIRGRLSWWEEETHMRTRIYREVRKAGDRFFAACHPEAASPVCPRAG